MDAVAGPHPLIGIATTAAAGVYAIQDSRLTGVADESGSLLSTFVPGLDFPGLLTCGLILAGLGVHNDVTITQSSSVWELRAATPDATRRAVFAYSGASLVVPLLLAVYDPPVLDLISSEGIAEEIVRPRPVASAWCYRVPVTTAIAAAAAGPSSANDRGGRRARPDDHQRARTVLEPEALRDGGRSAACRPGQVAGVTQHGEVTDHPARRRSLLKAAAAGAAAVAGLAAASRTGLLSGDGPPDGAGGLLQLSADGDSGMAFLEAPLGDQLLPSVGGQRWRSAHLPTSTHSMVGFVWRRDQPEPRLHISSRRAGRWTPWRPVPVLHDLPDQDDAEWAARAGTQLIWVGDADGIRIRADGQRPAGITLVLLHPARQAGDVLSAPLARSGDAVLLPPRPPMLGRRQWGADESWRNGAPRYNETIEQVHVHHTANSNDYAEDDVPAILRGIYRYHTSSLGWSDIAYNFLVDRFGRTWVGRAGGAAKPVRGAHTLGFNGTSAGIAVIGNFDSLEPGAETIDAIVGLAAWKLAPYQRDPEGTVPVVSEGSDKYASAQVAVLPVIDGHRDTNDTACPGQLLYDRLPDVRSLTTLRMAVTPAVAITQPFVLAGDTVAGAALSVTPGAFTPPEALVTYTWLRDGLPTGDDPSLSSRTSLPEDVGHQLTVQVDVQATGWTGASQMLTAPAVIATQAVVDVRAHAHRGKIRVVVRVSAPGLTEPPTGELLVRADQREWRTAALANGTALVRLLDFGPGSHVVKVRYAGTDLVRGARGRLVVRVKN